MLSFVTLMAEFKPFAASSTTAEFVWDGDFRARHGRGDEGKAVGSRVSRRLCCLSRLSQYKTSKSQLSISMIAVTPAMNRH